jgi:putative phage-type endonuclease
LKYPDLEQGSDEWHLWRKQGIGASEAPMVLGISPYKSIHKLWQEKTGAIEEKDGYNYVFEKGKEIEAKARAYFELMNDKDCPPMCMDIDEFPMLRCSLDGYNEKENFALEIKYVGKDAMSDEIPAHHIAQLQHQMMVCGATDITYIRSNDGVTFKTDVIKRDEAYIKDLKEKELAFWKMVEDKIEPPKPEKKPRKKRDPKRTSA